MRALADAAAEDSGSATWRAERHFPEQHDSSAYVSAPVGDYIAAMGPAVGLALSAWLDREAEWWDAVTVSTPLSTHDQALVVARAINQAQP